MEKWELLGNGVGVFTNGDHGLTTDAILLADFSMPKKGELCADFGTGCGSIPMLWYSRGAGNPCTAVEIQPAAAELAERSVEKNGFTESITVINGDIRQYKSILPHQGFHLIVCNPPYFSQGLQSEGERGAARHDVMMTLTDLCEAANFSLRFGGRLCICFPTNRMAEVIELFRKNGLEPKRLRTVQSTAKKQPYLFLMECRKGGKTGLEMEPALIIKDENGSDTAELIKIYGEYINE